MLMLLFSKSKRACVKLKLRHFSCQSALVACFLLIFGILIIYELLGNGDEQLSVDPGLIKESDRIVKSAGHYKQVSEVVFDADVVGNYEISEQAHRSGPGEQGEAVSMDMNDKLVRKAIVEFGFNTAASDQISMNRSIPDTRPKDCKHYLYPDSLPTASVVIVFHNEGWSPLLRTVHSVLLRSPIALLKEVVMIDDKSNKPHLESKLKDYIKQFSGKVKLFRNAKREGLIRSRSIGAEKATGDVVIFLDAHCEANVNWLPPLLAPIAANNKAMTVPVIDSIDLNTWAYRSQYGYGRALFRGIFEWGLLYKENELTGTELKRRARSSEPFRSPTHAGGLFAVSRLWFEKLGYYDPGLQIWGGENFELSFKIWQCGGEILNVPCSRVGHVYRNRMPYGFGGLSGPIVSLNYKRVAEVWMDEYKEFYYRREPFIRKHDAGDISAQLKIREENNCKSFKWYMENVAYDVPIKFPYQPPNVLWGEIVNEESDFCLDTMGRGIPGILGVSTCHHQGGNQLFRLNEEGQLTTGEWCVTPIGKEITTGRCEMGHVDGPWQYNSESHELRLKNSEPSNCLAAFPHKFTVAIVPCSNPNDGKLKWIAKEINL